LKIPELLQKRARISEDARALLLTAERETRSLTSEEQEKYDRMHADIEQVNRDIANERKMSGVDESLRGAPAPAQPGNAEVDNRVALDSFLRGGREALSIEQRESLAPVKGFRDGIVFRAASPLSDVTGAAGQYTVAPTFYSILTDARKWFGGMFQCGASVLRTATGAALYMPSANDTGNVGELLSENTQASQATTEMSFGQVELDAFKFSSKLVLVPIELLQDSAFDIGAYVAKKLGERLGRVQNTYLTTGTGTSQPKGVIAAATTGVTGATGQTTKCVYADLVNLIHKVDPAYRAGAKWMFHDTTAAMLENMVDGNGRPLLNSTLQGISGQVEAGSITGRATLLGYPVVINNDVAVMAANAKSIAFGDFSTYYIREVMDIMLVRFAEKYMDYGQVGFLAFNRIDGDQVDAGMHPIQLYVNSAT
jgi:HK97 family phage major capsid protein